MELSPITPVGAALITCLIGLGGFALRQGLLFKV